MIPAHREQPPSCPPLAQEAAGAEQLVAAGRAADASEAVFQEAAAQVALGFALNKGRQFALG